MIGGVVVDLAEMTAASVAERKATGLVSAPTDVVVVVVVDAPALVRHAEGALDLVLARVRGRLAAAVARVPARVLLAAGTVPDPARGLTRGRLVVRHRGRGRGLALPISASDPGRGQSRLRGPSRDRLHLTRRELGRLHRIRTRPVMLEMLRRRTRRPLVLRMIKEVKEEEELRVRRRMAILPLLVAVMVEMAMIEEEEDGRRKRGRGR